MNILRDYSGSKQPDIIQVGKGYRLNFNHETIPAGEETAEQIVCDFVPQYWQEEVVVENPTVEDFKQLVEEYENIDIIKN